MSKVVRDAWPRLLNAALGLWLIVSPAILNFSGTASTNQRIVGPVAFSLAVIAIQDVTRPARWVNLLLGGWLILTPFILGYIGSWVPLLNSLVVGLLMAALALVEGPVRNRFNGGWSSLWRSE